jgi:hypothetical protein
LLLIVIRAYLHGYALQRGVVRAQVVNMSEQLKALLEGPGAAIALQ